MGNQLRCFVVSPIGDKDTDIRRRSDDLFDLIIEPALEKYDFDITRADKLTTVAHITSEIIELIQNCDLCFIDITGHNPNVMYECGRRHETGKPYIMLAQAGESLPFDVTTIRTVFYDLTSAKSVREAVKIIQSFTEKHMELGFTPSTSGDSLASVSESLKRMERHLEFLVSRQSSSKSESTSVSGDLAQVIKELGPTQALNYAFASRNVDLADAVLPLLRGRTNHEHFVKAGLTQACVLGSKVAIDYMEEEIQQLEKYDLETQKELVACYISGLNRTDQEARGMQETEGLFESIKAGTSPTANGADDRAFFLNQYQRLLNGASHHQEALEIGNLVITLNPCEPAYYYNQAINYRENGDLDRAVELIRKCIEMGSEDDDHLSLAIRLFANAGAKADVVEAMSKLRDVSPLNAAVVEEIPEVKEILKKAN
jgi:tetratricopeptide (TPR) repeat protein